jgi:hypothetical protein
VRTAADTLAVARRNLGIAEGKNNDNPYAAIAGDANHAAWCASFVRACLVVAGVIKKGAPSAYCPTFKESLQPVARADVRPGDVMFIWFPSMGRVAHTGLVEAVFPTYVVTIEGNTDVAGGRTGGKVMRKKRAYKGLSFGRPPYAAPKPAPTPTKVTAKVTKAKPDPILREGNRGQLVLNVQKALLKHGFRTALDGDFGPATKRAVMAFQKKKGLTVDGVVGQATWNALRSAS